MKPSNLLRFYVLRLRVRLVQELFAVLGIAVGVALLFASQVANTSLSGSVDQLTSGIVGRARLQLAARAPQGFDERLLGEVQRLRGVESAAPVLEADANVVGPRGRRSIDLIGIDPSFVRLHGVLLRHFTPTQLARQQALGLPAGLADEVGATPLQTVEVQVAGRSIQAIVGLVVREAEIGALVHSPLAVAPLAYAQQMTGMVGHITRVLVQPQPGRDREVRAELTALAGGTANVRTADFDAAIFGQAEGPTVQSTELFSAVSALVGFLFAFTAMLLTARRRRDLVADLRLDGYTPWEIVKVLLVDALILGVVGSLAGLLLGSVFARHLIKASPGYLSLAFAVGSREIVTWQSIALAGIGGVLAACCGVLSALRDVFARRPLAHATSDETPGRALRWLLPAGVACLGITTCLLIAGIDTVQLAVVSFVCLVIATCCFLPLLLEALIAIFDRLQRTVVGASPHIALMELRSGTARTRSLAIAATGAVAVFGSVAIEGARKNLQSGLNRVDVDVNLVSDLWVSPSGTGNTLATVPFSARATTTLRRISSVRSVGVYRGAFLDVGNHRTLVMAPPRLGPDPVPPNQVVAGDAVLAAERLRGHGWLTISRTVAEEYGVRVGQPFLLPAPHPTLFRVAAITTNFGWPPGAIVLNADDYARAWGSTDPSAYEIDLRPGISVQRGQREVQAALGPHSSLVVQTALQREESDREAQHQGLARLDQIATLVLIAAVLAMAAAMAAMIWQRRGRLAAMQVDGFERGELWRALLYESALLLGAGCSIGAVFGLYGQVLLGHALVTVTGFPATSSVGVSIACAICGLVTVTAVGIVAVPGYWAASVRPALQE